METLTKIRYHQPDLDARVASRPKEIELGIISNAENYGGRNQPAADNENVQSFFEEDHLKFQGLIDEVNQSLQVNTSIHHVVEHKQVTENKVREVLNKQSVVRQKQNQNTAQLHGKKPPFSKRILRFILIATAVLIFGDVIFNIPVFVTYGYNKAEAFFLSLIFAFLLGILAHFFKRIISWGKTVWQQRIIAIGLLLLMVVLFYTMAAHRAQFLEVQASDDAAKTISVSPIPFAIISLLLFLGAVVINDFYFPSKVQRDAMLEYQRLIKEKQELDDEYARLKNEEAAIENDHVEVRHMNASILEYGCSLEELIISKAHEGFALWKKHNMLYRKDNCRPRSFDKPGYPLPFRTNFQKIKTQNNHEIYN
ncbi:MAG TPA: hypothetical protein VFE53_26990 [Mucilaginibacter sp.]|nr:hypothetical protein [Mucilaginibacter sp.]